MWDKLKALFKREKPFELSPDHVVVYHVHEGPFYYTDIPDTTLEDTGGLEFGLLCKLHHEGEVFDDFLWFDTLDRALELKDQFKYSLAPVVLGL